MSERKRVMMMAVWHKEQLGDFARILNSSHAPYVEKLSLLGMAIRDSNDAKRLVVEYYRSMSSSDTKKARELLAKNVGIKPAKAGVHWCVNCSAVRVGGPFQRCQKCIDKSYTSQDLQDAVEPFTRVRDPDSL